MTTSVLPGFVRFSYGIPDHKSQPNTATVLRYRLCIRILKTPPLLTKLWTLNQNIFSLRCWSFTIEYGDCCVRCTTVKSDTLQCALMGFWWQKSTAAGAALYNVFRRVCLRQIDGVYVGNLVVAVVSGVRRRNVIGKVVNTRKLLLSTVNFTSLSNLSYLKCTVQPYSCFHFNLILTGKSSLFLWVM